MDGTFTKVRAFVVTDFIQKGSKRIITGVASTINPDLDGEQMSLGALESMVQQIRKNPIPLRSEHKDNWEDELGKIYDADVDGRNLIIKAELYNTSKANDLWEHLKNGSKLGLSIGGQVIKAGWELCESLGQQIKTFKDIKLNEISVTSKPANTMTWLHVIAKSVNFEKGDNMENVDTTEEVVEVAPEAEVEAPVAEPVEAPAEVVEAEEVVEKEEKVEATEELVEAPVEEAEVIEAAPAPETEEVEVTDTAEEVEKAGRKFSKKTEDKVRSFAEAMLSMLEGDDDEEKACKPKTMKSVGSAIDQIINKAINDGLAQREEEISVLKSKVEKLEKLPLQRKGIAQSVTKTFVDEKEVEPVAPAKNFAEAYKSLTQE